MLDQSDSLFGHETSFQGTFDKEFWYGNVFAYPISSTGIVNYAASDWPGGAMYFLSLQDYDSGRRIVTVSNGAAVPFRWDSLNSSQQTALGSVDILNYVRGDRSNENAGLSLRVRKAVLGAHHALAPLYARRAALHRRERRHAARDQRQQQRRLGARRPEGGELYAYIPSLLIPKLKNLAVDPYVHTYFVDGPVSFGIPTFKISGVDVRRKVVVGTLRRRRQGALHPRRDRPGARRGLRE